MEGNPCNVATGNKYQLEVDFAGSGPFPLRFERHYNSDLDTPSSTLGPQWRHTFDRKIVFSDHSSISSIHTGPLEAFVYRSDGKVIVFQIDGTTVTPRDTDTTATLTKLSGSTWEYTGPDDVAELYTIANEGGQYIGRLATLTSRGGHTLTLSYSADRVATVTDDFSRQISFTYASGRLATMTDPNGEEYTYSYDSNGYLSEVKYPDETPGSSSDNPTREYLYEDTSNPGALTSIINENGDVHGSWEYDGSRRAISSERDGGFNRLDFTYNGNGTTTVEEDGGETRVYEFDIVQNVRRPVSVTASSTSELTSYDENGFLESRTGRNGAQTDYTFDSRGLEVERIEAVGTADERTIETEWHSTFRVPVLISAGTKETSFQYDTFGRLTSATISDTQTAASRTTSLTYTTTGLVETIDGPRTDVTDEASFTYSGGDLVSFSNSAGHVTTFDLHDDVGRVLQMTDANGLVTEYEYDARGRLLTITETPPIGPSRVTAYAYDGLGQLVNAELPNGMELTYTYTPARYLATVTDNFGSYLEFTYDDRGNVEEANTFNSSDTLKRTMSWIYDARSRIETVNNAGSLTEFVYDNEGNVESEEDPNSNLTTFSYDPLSRVTEALDALSGVTTLEYDRHDQLTALETPNGATTDYTYDALGNLLSIESPDTGTTSFSYDSAGNMVSQTDANSVTVAYTYDALNRLTAINYPGSSLDVNLSYDQGTAQKGRLTTLVDGSGTTSFEYDVFGNLVEESRTIGGNTHVTAYTYDEADLVTSVTYPSAREVDYTRDVVGQVTTVATTYNGTTTTLASSVSYEPFGPLKALTFGNSLVLARTFDQQYRLTDQSVGTVQDLAFTIDDAGNVDAVADGLNAALSQGFDQDALHRLTTDAGSYGTKSYTYDGVDNRLSRTHGGTTQTLTYAANSNRLATHSSQTVNLDSAGNVLANPAENVSFTYGAHNRILQAYVGSVLKASYVYDGRGQRVKKIEATGAQRTIIYHYAKDGELIGETIYSSAGAKIGERDYVWLDTLPLAQSERVFSGGVVASSSFVYLHADHLKTPRLATNATGTVVWRWDSDAFGVGAANEDPDGDTTLVSVRLRFRGQYLDDETGMHYNYFRDYDPVTGRYLQSDPAGQLGGLGTYSYARANPLRWTDRLGLLPDCDFIPQWVEPRSWTEYDRDVWGYYYRPTTTDLDGVVVTDNLDPRQPKRPPVTPGIRIQVWLAKFEFGWEREYLVRQTIEHLRAYCTAVINVCGQEQEIVMEPFDVPRRGPEIRTLVSEGFYERALPGVGVYVDLGLK